MNSLSRKEKQKTRQCIFPPLTCVTRQQINEVRISTWGKTGNDQRVSDEEGVHIKQLHTEWRGNTSLRRWHWTWDSTVCSISEAGKQSCLKGRETASEKVLNMLISLMSLRRKAVTYAHLRLKCSERAENKCVDSVAGRSISCKPEYEV